MLFLNFTLLTTFLDDLIDLKVILVYVLASVHPASLIRRLLGEVSFKTVAEQRELGSILRASVDLIQGGSGGPDISKYYKSLTTHLLCLSHSNLNYLTIGTEHVIQAGPHLFNLNLVVELPNV